MSSDSRTDSGTAGLAAAGVNIAGGRGASIRAGDREMCAGGSGLRAIIARSRGRFGHRTGEPDMAYISTRRTFAQQAGLLVVGARFARWLDVLGASDLEHAIADTSTGKVRGVVVEGTRVFKGIPCGASLGC